MWPFRRKKKEAVKSAPKTITYPNSATREIDRDYYRRVDHNDMPIATNTIIASIILDSYDDSCRNSPISWDNGASSPSYDSGSSSSYDSGSSCSGGSD